MTRDEGGSIWGLEISQDARLRRLRANTPPDGTGQGGCSGRICDGWHGLMTQWMTISGTVSERETGHADGKSPPTVARKRSFHETKSFDI